jgi:DNA polymerase III epsilon subunit-like protein
MNNAASAPPPAVVVRLRPVRAATGDGTVKVRCAFRKPRYLVFDTETDGSANLCIELAFLVLDDAYEECARYSAFWKLPEGRTIAPHAQKVHGITASTLRTRGESAAIGLDHFFAWVDRIRANNGLLVAHNAAFDAAAITVTAKTWGKTRTLEKKDCFCTMNGARHHAGCRDRRDRTRAPRNAELYDILHGSAPTWAALHTALDDVRVTACNFEAGRKRGWWA